MAYCDIADVQALNPKRTYDGGSTPTQTQVGEFIDRVTSEIDTVLSGRGLTVPVTAPAAFVDHLKQVNAYGAAALAEAGMFPESFGVGYTPHGAWLWSRYRDAIKELRDGELPVGSGGELQPESFFTKYPTTEPTAEEEWRRPKFGKDKEF